MASGLRVVAAMTAACGVNAIALAQNEWTTPAGGFFGDAANWSTGVPTEADKLFFGLAAEYTVTLQQDRRVDSLLVGKSDLTLDMGGNTLTLTGADGFNGTGEFEIPILPALRITNGDLVTASTDFRPVSLRFLTVDVGQGGRLFLSRGIGPVASIYTLTADDAYMRASGLGLASGEAFLTMTNGSAADIGGLSSENSSLVRLDGKFTSLRVDHQVRFGAGGQHEILNGAALSARDLRVFGSFLDFPIGGSLVIDGAGSNAAMTGVTEITDFRTTVDLTNRGTLTSGSVIIDDRARVTINGLGSRLAADTTVTVDDAWLVLQDRARVESPVVRVGFGVAFNQSSFLGGHGVVVGDVEVGSATLIGSTIGVTERLEITGDLSADGSGGFDLPELRVDVSEQLVVGGTADLSNFILRVGADPSTTPLYRRFVLVDAGSIAGQFADIVLPSVGAAQSAVEIAGGVVLGAAPTAQLTDGYSWVVTYTANTVELQLIPAPGALTVAPLLGFAAMRRRR